MMMTVSMCNKGQYDQCKMLLSILFHKCASYFMAIILSFYDVILSFYVEYIVSQMRIIFHGSNIVFLLCKLAWLHSLTR